MRYVKTLLNFRVLQEAYIFEGEGIIITGIEVALFSKVFEKILNDPSKTIKEIDLILKELDLPNVNFPTMGGNSFWNDLANISGWRLQQNTVTKHCRILDPDNIRRAWGGEEVMNRLINKLSKV